MWKVRGQKGLVLCEKRVNDIIFVRIRRADPGFANGRGEKKSQPAVLLHTFAAESF